MKVLFLDSPAFGKEDMIEAFMTAGWEVVRYYDDRIHHRVDAQYEQELTDAIAYAAPQLVFSFNYYPMLSRGCMRQKVKYISYVYDNPHVNLYSNTVLNPCNFIFLFDKAQYIALREGGIDTVFYLPLAANAKRLSAISLTSAQRAQLAADVSFVGSLYDEKHNLYDRMGMLDEYTRGYLEAVMESQLQVQGYYFVDEVLTSDVLRAMSKALPYEPQPDGVETERYFYSDYVLARKITAVERKRLLRGLSERFSLRLYTHHRPQGMPKAQYIGAIDWEESFPAVCKASSINLNITLRSIRSGIPLRSFEIMGSGGFLLTNYQEDMLDFFVPGEDFVYYESEEDLYAKTEYYLSHAAQRSEIAKNGYEKVSRFHTYEIRLEQMLSVVRGENRME